MTFPELLNTYIRRFHCTAGELADVSGLTQASLSRYRNGQRVPETETLKKLAAGIVRIAKQNECTDLDFDLVFAQLAEAADIVETDHAQFSGQFSVLVVSVDTFSRKRCYTRNIIQMMIDVGAWVFQVVWGDLSGHIDGNPRFQP